MDADNKRKKEELEVLKKIESRLLKFCSSKSLKFEKIVENFGTIKKKNNIDKYLEMIDDKFLRLEIVSSIYKIFYSDKEYHKDEHEFIAYISKFWNLK